MTFVVGEFNGMSLLQAALKASPEIAVTELAGAMWREANSIIDDSVPLVPVKNGILRGSHTVEMPKIDGMSIEVRFGYGGAASAYSVIQHERTDFKHTVGQAHYLSDPFNAHAPMIEARLGADMQARNLFPGLA